MIEGFSLFVLIPAVVLACVAYLVIRRGVHFRRLLKDGVETTGTVVSMITFRGKGSARGRYLRYEYRDAVGRLHSHRSLVSREIWDSVEEGGQIAIVYSSSKPEISAPAYLVEINRAATNKGKDAP